MKIENIRKISNVKSSWTHGTMGHGGSVILRSTTSYVGDNTINYYGTLTPTEFFTAQELYTHYGLTEGSVSNVTKWFKVEFKGKILFYPLENVADNISFQTLYQAGLVYGERGFGKYPAGGDVDQFNTIRKDGVTYIPRLFSVFNTDPHNGSVGRNLTNMQGSEWAELVYRISRSNPYYTTDNFEVHTIPCNGVLAREAFNSTGTIKTCIGNAHYDVADISNQSGGATHAGLRYWKPVLELVK